MHIAVFAGLVAVCAGQSTSQSNVTPVGWHTYHSTNYGFSIDYPIDGSFGAGDRVGGERSMIPICDSTSVACFEYTGHAFVDTVIQSLGVSVNILREETTEADCTDMDDISHTSKVVVIHKTRFHVAEIGSAAAGSSESGTIYHAFHQHVCFEISLGTAYSDIGPAQYEEYGLHPVDANALRAVQGEMNRMLHSFRFKGTTVLGAASSTRFKATARAGWQTYRDPDYGFTIDHPDDFPETSSCMFEPVACFEYNGNALHSTVIMSVRVTVDILRERKTEAECDDIDEEPVTTVVIHKTRFSHAETGDAGMSKSEAIEDYLAFHDNVCFEIALITGRIDVGPVEYDDLGIHPVDQKALQAVHREMNRMLHSFRLRSQVR